MSYVIAAPEAMTAAAADLATIGSTLDEAHATAATPTVALAPAAADEVSVAVAHLFSKHAEHSQAAARAAAAFQGQFVENLKAGATAYSGIEGAIVSWLNGLETDLRDLWLVGLILGIGYAGLTSSLFDSLPPGRLSDILAAAFVGLPFLLIVGGFTVATAVGVALIDSIIAAITALPI